MTSAAPWLHGAAVAFNVAAALGCIALAAVAPNRAGTLLAGGGCVFFALAAAGFVVLTTLARRAAARRGSGR